MREKLANTLTRAASIGGGGERDDRLGALAGFGSLAMIFGADIAFGESVVLVGAVVLAPFFAAFWGGVALTAAVALLAIAVGAASGIWNMNVGDTDYEAVVILVIGGLLAVASAWARGGARLATKRLELLDEVGAIADGSLPLAETLERVLEVIVPPFADFCVVDVIHGHRVIRSAVRAGGRHDAGAIEDYLAGREPSLPDWMTRPEAPFPRQPLFTSRFNDEDVRRLAHGSTDLEWMRSLGLSSSITVAMLARDRILGALTLCTAWSGRAYSIEDVRFAQALASRVALVLDNAGLFSDLKSVELRMDNVMSLLDEAVVIHDADGELVYANPAAARLMGFDPGEDPASMSIDQIGARFHVRAEDGRPLPADEVIGRRALSGDTTGPLVVRATLGDGARERWLITRAQPIMGLEGRALYSVTAIQDVTAVKRAESAQGLLARVGDLLATTTDPDSMLAELAELAVPEFAEWCAVDVPGKGGLIDQVALAHQDPERRRQALDMRERFPLRLGDPDGVAEVLRTGAAQLVARPDELIARAAVDPEHERLMRSLGLRSVMLVPMSSVGRTVGALTFGNGAGERPFDKDDFELAAELARRAGTAVEIARLAQERAEVARILQEGLMPPALPQMRGWETAAVYQPAGEVNDVGGDFYDAFEVEGGWMVIVGDVVGRGAAAASLTALARHTIKTAGSLTSDPCKALALVDEALRSRRETALCTAAILLLPHSEAETTKVPFVSAGHPLPLRLRDGEVEEVGRPGPLLGAFAGSEWKQQALELRAGDLLVVYTDGVIEARGTEERFGEERLRSHLAGADRPLTVIGRVTAALDGFLAGEPEDDVAVVALRWAGSQRLEAGAESASTAAIQ